MSTDTPHSLTAAREHTIEELCRRFAQDDLGLNELERRLDRARAAGTRDELDALLTDLGPSRAPVEAGTEAREPTATATTTARSSEPAHPRPSGHLAFAVMGGTRRSGRWVPPGNMTAVAIMGGVELDFREAVLTGGVTEINCFAFWGGVEITVPPDVHVDSHGFALMGGFEQDAELETNPAPGAHVIRVNGFALMGGVEINVAERGRKPGGAR